MNDAPEADDRQLLRILGPNVAIAMVVGNVIGAGIFMKPAEAVKAAGSFPVVMGAWTVGGLICFLGALCFAELAVMFPRAGGMYVYLREAYGLPVAFLFGWSEFIFGRPASIGALATGVVLQFGPILRRDFSPVVEVTSAVALIAILAAVNVFGVIWGGRTQVATTFVKAGFLAFLALLPWLVMLAGGAGVERANFQSSVTPERIGFAAQFAGALLAIMWAYNGWHAVTPLAEELRNPQRTIPWALFTGLTLLVVLYLGVNVAYHGVLDMPEIAGAGIELPQVMLERLLTPWGSGAAQAGIAVISFVAICSMLGAINANMMNGPRIAYAMGRDRIFFGALGQIHARFRTPAIAIVVQAVLSSVLVIASAVLVRTAAAFRETSVFEILTNSVIFVATVVYMLVVGAVLVLRIRDPDRERPFRTPGYPLLPILFLLLNVWFLYHLYAHEATRSEANIGLLITLAGLPVYAVFRYRLKTEG